MNTINWLKIFEKYNTQEIIIGKILKKIPGGLTINVYGAEAFLPWSQVPQNIKDMRGNIFDSDINTFASESHINKILGTHTKKAQNVHLVTRFP